MDSQVESSEPLGEDGGVGDVGLRLVGVSGSLTAGGHTRASLEVAMEAAENGTRSVASELLDLRDFTVSFADGRPLEAYDDDTPHVVQAVSTADAVILASPVYRGSYPAALKNLLDHVPVEGLCGKTVGLIATGASPHHYLAIDHQFRAVLAWFGAYLAPGSAYVQNSDFRAGQLVGDRAIEHLRQLGPAVVSLAKQVRELKTLPPPLVAWTQQ